jgi:predicted RNA-binding Zn-ribbon protein involved in translation (DUF1610 family)
MKDYGIDYGRGLTNIDLKTGIHYGVIQHNEIGNMWYEAAEALYVYHCPHCGKELKKGIQQKKCGSCRREIDPENNFDDCVEIVSYFVKNKNLVAEQMADNEDIFVIKAKYYTYAKFCSPCAPGACYLNDSIQDDPDAPKAYCFNHNWFEGGKAPYRVYSVKTGKEVLPN